MISGSVYFKIDQLQELIGSLQQQGYTCIGPQVRDGAIIYDELHSTEQLPRGIHDSQSPGQYSLASDDSNRYFAWANGPQAIRPLLFQPVEKLWHSQFSQGHLEFSSEIKAERKLAIIAARACDIAALKLHDQHFLNPPFIDSHYQARREASLIIAVNCSHPAETCFCHSTGDGPFVEDGYDIALTELSQGFIAKAISDTGIELLATLQTQDSTPEQLNEAEQVRSQASRQHRSLPLSDIQAGLLQQLHSPAWQEIATRCLSCGNCTSVCPTCFCHREYDEPSLDGLSSSHYREWDSCFTQGHSYIHGITIRSDTAQRYRQWLTHKFSTWHEQYGRSGCVGCGRCITWCPVGIDVIESINSVLETEPGEGNE